MQALWLDPVHDFGFFRFGSHCTVWLSSFSKSCQAKPSLHSCRFDPSKVKFQKLASVPLYPKGAEVGVEVRVVVSMDAFASLTSSLQLTRRSALPAAGE